MKKIVCAILLLMCSRATVTTAQTQPVTIRYYVPSFDNIDAWRDHNFSVRIAEVNFNKQGRPNLAEKDGCTFRLEALQEDAEITAECKIALKTRPKSVKILYRGRLSFGAQESKFWPKTDWWIHEWEALR